MSLAFLYPLAWLGALAVGVPIWLHLRRREDPRVIHFSAMRFLDDEPLARERPLWPRDWPLMLLRLAALVLLVAAFAWPYLPVKPEILIRESRVYVLDNTLSHQLAGRFQAARHRTAEELSRSGLETQIAVVELTATPKLVVGFADDRTIAAETVRQLEPSHARGSYLDAFRMASQLLEQSLGQDKRIILVGDSQENQWTEGLGSPPFLEDIEVELPEVQLDRIANLALADPMVRRVFAGDRLIAECTVRVLRQGEVGPATLVFGANGRDVAQRQIVFEDDSESLTVSAQWEIEPLQWLQGEVRLDPVPDELAADNRVVFSLPPLREGRVTLLANSIYLRTALAPDIMRGRWQTRGVTIANLTSTQGDSRDDDVVCVESHFLTSSKVRDLVLDALNRGRGVVLVVGPDTPAISGFLRELGIEVSPEGVSSELEAGFRYVSFDHPIFQPFRSPDFGSLSDITVNRYRRLNVASAVPLLFSAAGDPLLVESPKGKGKLLVFAFALSRSETNWPLDPTFVPFLDKCLQYVRPQAETMETTYEPGETCVWTVPPDRDVQEVILQSAENAGKPLMVRATVTDGQARVPIPSQPGHYELRYDGDSEVQSVLNVNPSPLESQLTFTAEPAALAAWRQETDSAESTKAGGFEWSLTRQEILRQRIWWWLVLAGLGAMIVETTWISLRRSGT